MKITDAMVEATAAILAKQRGEDWADICRYLPQTEENYRAHAAEVLQSLPSMEGEGGEEQPQIMRSIQVVVGFLNEEFIIEDCDKNPVMGCMSCQSIDLRDKLLMLSREIMDGAHHHHQFHGAPVRESLSPDLNPEER